MKRRAVRSTVVPARLLLNIWQRQFLRQVHTLSYCCAFDRSLQGCYSGNCYVSMITRVLRVPYLLKAMPEVQFRDAHQQTDGQKVERPSDRLSSSGCRGEQGAVAGR